MKEPKAGPEKDQFLQDVLDRLAIVWQNGDPPQIEKTEREFVEKFLPIGLHYCNAIAGKTGMWLYDRNGYALGGIGQALAETRPKKSTVSAMRRLIYLRCFDIIQEDQSILSDTKGEVKVRRKRNLLYRSLDEAMVAVGMEEQQESDEAGQENDSLVEAEKSLREMLLEICSEKRRRQKFIDDYRVASPKRIALFEKWESEVRLHPTVKERSLNPTVRDWYCTAFAVNRKTYDKAKWDLKQDMAQFLSTAANH